MRLPSATLLILLLSVSCQKEEYSITFLNQIELIAPASGAVMDNGCSVNMESVDWYFEWTYVPIAQQYELYVESKDGSVLVMDVTTYSTSQSYSCSGCSFYHTDWIWKIRVMVGGEWQPWSHSQPFTLEPVDTDC
jgi:hypothetical protein